MVSVFLHRTTAWLLSQAVPLKGILKHSFDLLWALKKKQKTRAPRSSPDLSPVVEIVTAGSGLQRKYKAGHKYYHLVSFWKVVHLFLSGLVSSFCAGFSSIINSLSHVASGTIKKRMQEERLLGLDAVLGECICPFIDLSSFFLF